MTNIKSIVFLTAFISISGAASAQELSLNAYLDQVTHLAGDIKAIDYQKKSLIQEIKSRDSDLITTLDVSLIKFWDHRPTTSSNPQKQGNEYEVSLAKPLPTGTTLNLLSALDQYDYRTVNDNDNTLDWQAGITQSLWQDSFGHQTRLRRHRDQQELASRLLGLILKEQQVRLILEGYFWDLAYAKEEWRVAELGLKRSQDILTWVEDRYQRMAAIQSDVLQAKALVARRELELEIAQDKLKTVKANIMKQINIEDIDVLSAALQEDRDIDSLFVRSSMAKSEPVLIETLQAEFEKDAQQTAYKLEVDKSRPALDVGYSYGQRGINSSFSRAREGSFDSSQHYHQVGLTVSIPIDFHVLAASKEAAKLKADAQEVKSSQLKQQSVIGWQDLNRQIMHKRQQVVKAKEIAQLQLAKSQEERQLFEKGKSTAFQVITFEQEASESELLVLELLAQLRRQEAQARLYIIADQPS